MPDLTLFCYIEGTDTGRGVLQHIYMDKALHIYMYTGVVRLVNVCTHSAA